MPRRPNIDPLVAAARALEMDTIQAIADRAQRMAIAARNFDVDRMTFFMAVTAAHNNGYRLRLADLATADDFNFAHDVFGIVRHLDPMTYVMGDHFRPRFLEKKLVAA